nr:M14 metal carboxypeptidase 3 [Antheraea yamamai]
MYLKHIFFILYFIFTITKSEYVSYRKYKVYKVIPETEKNVQILVDLQKNNHFTFWSDTIEIGSNVRIMITPEEQKEFEDYMNNVGMNFSIAINDVQDAIDAQLYRPPNRDTSEYAWDYYQTLEEIYDWVDKIAEQHTDVVTLVTMGYSVEGRPIKGVKIDHKKRANSTIGMIEGGIHAREWISPATTTWIIKEFLTSTNPDVRFIAENIVWHIFPVTNPDGYVYTFTNNRMWRKNRNTANFTSCAQWNLNDDMSNGIDLNRNFGFLWMTTGASSNPCSEIFAGPTPFSEPEALSIATYVNKIQEEGNLVFYYAFHSFSQLVLVPFSHVGGADVLAAPNYGDLYEIAIKGMEKLKLRHGTDYIVGTSADILYEVSGSSFDWVKGDAHVPIVYLFELRDDGNYGFLLPAPLIVPNNEEIIDGLIEMDRVARAIGYYRSSGYYFKINVVVLILSLIVIL